MPTIDLQINANIRAILARHWIDAEKLHFRTTGGTVRFHGVLARQGSIAVPDLDTTLVEVLVTEMRRTPGVLKVYFTGVEVERRNRVLCPIESGEIHSYEVKLHRKPQAPKPLTLEPHAVHGGNK
jgi:hypothetical protein